MNVNDEAKIPSGVVINENLNNKETDLFFDSYLNKYISQFGFSNQQQIIFEERNDISIFTTLKYYKSSFVLFSVILLLVFILYYFIFKTSIFNAIRSCKIF